MRRPTATAVALLTLVLAAPAAARPLSIVTAHSITEGVMYADLAKRPNRHDWSGSVDGCKVKTPKRVACRYELARRTDGPLAAVDRVCRRKVVVRSTPRRIVTKTKRYPCEDA
jgi:hypothetical protein